MNREEIKKNANFLALILAYLIKEIGYSPNTQIFDGHYIENIKGKPIKVSSAYSYVKRNIKYVDDAIIDKINSNECIKTKLKKDCNNK